MKKLLMIIVSGALLTGMLACSSDALVDSVDNETTGVVTKSEVLFNPEYLYCGAVEHVYRIDYPSRLQLVSYPSWIIPIEPTESEDFGEGDVNRAQATEAHYFKVLANQGTARFGEIVFTTVPIEVGGVIEGWRKRTVVPVRQSGEVLAVVPISIQDPLPVYCHSPRAIEVTLNLDHSIQNIKVHWSAYWIHHLSSTSIITGITCNTITMRFIIDEFEHRLGPGLVEIDMMRDLQRCGAIRLKYQIDGKTCYEDIFIEQHNDYHSHC